MVAYVLYRVFFTFVLGPLAGVFFYGHIGAYFASLTLVAVAALTCSFFEKRFATFLLSACVGLAAICFWCLTIFDNRA